MSYRKGFILIALYWAGLFPLTLGGYAAIRLVGPGPAVFIMAGLMWALFGAFLLYRHEQMNHAAEVRTLSSMVHPLLGTAQDMHHRVNTLGELYNEEATILERLFDQMDAHFGVIEARLPQKKGALRKHVSGTTSPELTALDARDKSTTSAGTAGGTDTTAAAVHTTTAHTASSSPSPTTAGDDERRASGGESDPESATAAESLA